MVVIKYVDPQKDIVFCFFLYTALIGGVHSTGLVYSSFYSSFYFQLSYPKYEVM